MESTQNWSVASSAWRVRGAYSESGWLMGRRPLGIFARENRLSSADSSERSVDVGEESTGAGLKATAVPEPAEIADAGICDECRLTCWTTCGAGPTKVAVVLLEPAAAPEGAEVLAEAETPEAGVVCPPEAETQRRLPARPPVRRTAEVAGATRATGEKLAAAAEAGLRRASGSCSGGRWGRWSRWDRCWGLLLNWGS